jgi:hypothetical protein
VRLSRIDSELNLLQPLRRVGIDDAELLTGVYQFIKVFDGAAVVGDSRMLML